MKKTTIFTVIILLILLLSSCTQQEDIDNFVGDYESTYNGYMRLTFGSQYDEERLSGEDFFSIIYEGDGNNVILFIEGQSVTGKVRNKRVKFEEYYLTEIDEETNQKSVISYFMQGKLKNGEFHYGSILSGTAIVDNMILPIDGFIEGRAKKIKN